MKKITALLLSFTLIFTAFSIVGCENTDISEIKEYDGYTLYENFSYSRGERGLFDLCLPKNASGEVGLFLLIHGGSWVSGDKNAYLERLAYFAELGYAAAAINYRYISPFVDAFDILDDIESSLGAIKSLAAEHGVTLGEAIINGYSAGAHLALLYSYARADESPILPVAVISQAGPTDVSDSGYFEDHVFGVKADYLMSALSGSIVIGKSYLHRPEPLLAVSPISYVDESTVPTLICQGALDPLVPVSNAYTLDERLSAYGVTHELIIYENSGHELGYDPECAERTEKLFIEYAELYLKKYTEAAD